MSELSQLKVGDAVTVRGHSGMVERLGTVARILKTKIVLGDGSAWEPRRGRRLGHSRDAWYTGPRLVCREDGDELEFKRNEALSICRRFSEWTLLSDERLFAVSRILHEQEMERREAPNGR